MPTTTQNAYRMFQFFERLRSARPSDAFAKLNRLNLSFSHMRALHMLACCDTLAMKDLADRLSLTPPSVTALTRRLVQTGLVQRQTHAEDSRVVLLSLTDEGRALQQQMYESQLAGMERLLEGLAPEEQEQLLALLERAVQTMLTNADTEG